MAGRTPAPAPLRAGAAAAAARAAARRREDGARERDEKRARADLLEAEVRAVMVAEPQRVLEITAKFLADFPGNVARGREAMKTIERVHKMGVGQDVYTPAVSSVWEALHEDAVASIVAAMKANHEQLVVSLNEVQAKRARTVKSQVAPMLKDIDTHVTACSERASTYGVRFQTAAAAEQLWSKLKGELQGELQGELPGELPGELQGELHDELQDEGELSG